MQKAIITELVRVRKSKGISQKKLEELSGVKQPIIARIETNKCTPTLSTILKLLIPLDKTIVIEDCQKKDK